MKTQLARIEPLLMRGCTSMEICAIARTTTPSRRLSDLREQGWDIKRIKVDGKNYHRFFGTPPKGVNHG